MGRAVVERDRRGTLAETVPYHQEYITGSAAVQVGLGLERLLSAIICPADPKAGRPFLVAGPLQVPRELGIGPQRLDGIQLFGQGGFGKHGVQLPVAGWAELDLRAKLATTGARH